MMVEGGVRFEVQKKCNVSLSERGVRAEVQRSFLYIILTRAVASQREHLYMLITFFLIPSIALVLIHKGIETRLQPYLIEKTRSFIANFCCWCFWKVSHCVTGQKKSFDFAPDLFVPQAL